MTLPSRAADSLAQSIADVTAAGLPLAAGLRAAAAESDARRTAAALHRIADELDRGRSLEQVLADPSSRIPGYLNGLLRATLRTGDFGTAFLELIDHQERLREMRRAVWTALVYPAVLLLLSLALAAFVNHVLAGPLLDVLDGWFRDVGFRLPAMAHMAMLVAGWFHRTGIWYLYRALVVLVIVVPVLRWAAGPARWARGLATLPLFGVLWHWSGVAEWTRLVGVLVAHDIPLPEALGLAAAGVRDANLGQVSGLLARGVEQGRALSELLETTGRTPALLAPLVRWGEDTGRLAEALFTASDMYAGRVELRADMLRAILPPLIVIFVGIAVVAVLWLLILPTTVTFGTGMYGCGL
jgi:general secretion pathway protein F